MDFTNGIAPDTRTDEQKAKDWQHADTAGDILVTWVEKTPESWKKYTPREQDGSLSCCGQASAKAVEILNGSVMSAHPPYRSRINYPDGGMFLQDVGNVWKKVGSTLESLDASQFEHEAQMNRDITVPTPTKTAGYVFVNPKDIEAIAEAIELHKHCILIVHCSKSEWTAEPVYNGAVIDFGHCICAVDYFLKDGVKIILVEDSTGHFNSLDGNGQRLLTADFLSKRCEGAMYLTTTALLTKTLKFGMVDDEVKLLQEKLKAEGSFPSTQNTTTYFGNITLASVKAFQTKHGLVSDGIVGPITRGVINSL